MVDRANTVCERIDEHGILQIQHVGDIGGRVDKETGQGLPSNPYWDGDPASKRSRVWLYGLRNPYRFLVRDGTGSTDPGLGDPGTLYVGNTGWNQFNSIYAASSGG